MSIYEHQIRKLDRQEFAVSLQKGLGSALLYTKCYGLTGVDDLVLNACLHDQSWDPQVEGSKAKWLFSMFSDTQYYPIFSEAIIKALKTETEYWDVQQLFELAMEIALAGNELAKVSLRERALDIASQHSNPKDLCQDSLGVCEFIEVYGNQAVLELARIYGQRLLKNSNDWIPGEMWFIDNINDSEQKRMIFENSQTDPIIKVYWDYLNKEKVFEPIKKRTVPRNKEFRKEYPLERILRDAKNKEANFPGRYRAFGKFATKEELEIVYSQLLVEKNRAVRLRLLWVFHGTPIPRFNDVILKWADGKDRRLKEASLQVLSQIKDPKIHELARKIFLSGELGGVNTTALRLYMNNYDKEDAELITQVLLSLNPDREDAHNLVWYLTDVAEQNKDIGLAEVLRWGYEITPCSAHRFQVIQRLDDIRQFKGEIIRECLFDSNEDIRKCAKEKTNSSD
jgi:hypothetical protein